MVRLWNSIATSDVSGGLYNLDISNERAFGDSVSPLISPITGFDMPKSLASGRLISLLEGFDIFKSYASVSGIEPDGWLVSATSRSGTGRTG